MIRLEYLNKLFKIKNGYTIAKSSREVTFNSLIIDFTNKTIQDLPYKYQECKILEYDTEDEPELIKKGKTIFFGYVSNFKLQDMKLEKEQRFLEIELLSPLAMATKRTITAIGTYELSNLINVILEPLINDGYQIKEKRISKHQVTVNYLIETIESAMNKLSKKNSFWWYISENKEIYLYDIDYLLNLEPKIIYDTKLNGLYKLTPKADAIDYCNVVNISNVRLYSISDLDFKPLFNVENIIKKDDEIEFEHAIDIKPQNIIKAEDSQTHDYYDVDYEKYVAFQMDYEGGSVKVTTDGTNLYLTNCQIGDSSIDEEKRTWTLIQDPFFSTLIIGIRYNGTNNVTGITKLHSCSALIWTKYKMLNNKEINKMKGIISKTGIIENTINLGEQWRTYPELKEIAQSYINKESTKIDIVTMELDYDYNLNIGDIVKISKQGYMIDDKFIITDISETTFGIRTTWSITMRNSNYLENFIDLFRVAETEENENKTYNEVISNFDEESIAEVHEVEL